MIVGSALFTRLASIWSMAEAMSDAAGLERLIAAVDSRDGVVVIHGWRTRLSLTASEAVRILEPFVGEFLYTHVDREGLMQGTDMAAIAAVTQATTRALTAAGGITTQEEIDALDQRGIDAVVGMALYTGRLTLPPGARLKAQGSRASRLQASGFRLQASGLLASGLGFRHRQSRKQCCSLRRYPPGRAEAGSL